MKALVVLVLLAFGCGGNARDKALSATLVSVNAARDGFTTWDGQYQLIIVERAPSKADGTASLLEYRAAREPIAQAFSAAYRALAIAAIASGDDALTLQNAIHAGRLVLQQVLEFKESRQ